MIQGTTWSSDHVLRGLHMYSMQEWCARQCQCMHSLGQGCTQHKQSNVARSKWATMQLSSSEQCRPCKTPSGCMDYHMRTRMWWSHTWCAREVQPQCIVAQAIKCALSVSQVWFGTIKYVVHQFWSQIARMHDTRQVFCEALNNKTTLLSVLAQLHDKRMHGGQL